MLEELLLGPSREAKVHGDAPHLWKNASSAFPAPRALPRAQRPAVARMVRVVLHGYGQLARFFLNKFEGLEDGLLIAAPEGLQSLLPGRAAPARGRRLDDPGGPGA